MSDSLYDVGKIINTHGICGEVRVIRITDFDDRFDVGNTLYVEYNNDLIPLTIEGHRKHKQYDLLHFQGYDRIEDVERFKNTYLKINEEQLTELNEGEFYYHEIIGCEMVTTNGKLVGNIDHILSPGANDVWVVKQDDGKELLIPYIKDIVKQVNVEEKKVIIEPMEGLLD